MATIFETTDAATGLETIYSLTLGDIFVGSVAGSDETDRTLFTLQAGVTYNVTLTGLFGGGSTGRFSIANYDVGSTYWSASYGDGTLNGNIAGVQVTDIGGAWRAVFVAPVSGEYSLLVDDNGDPQAADYRMSISEGDGAAVTTHTVTDTSGNFIWAHYTDSFDLGGAHVLRELDYDDGREVTTVFANGLKLSSTVTDGNDAFGWDEIQRFYDVKDVLTNQRIAYDDGRVEVLEFEGGQRRVSTMTDVENAFSWSSYVDRFDAAGARTWRSMTLDNGQKIDTIEARGPFGGTAVTETVDAATGLDTIYTLTPGDSFAGSVAGSDEVDRLLVTLEAGETYTVTLTGLYGGGSGGSFSVAAADAGSTYWSVAYASGAVSGNIAGVQVVDTGGAWRATFVAPVDGAYSLFVDDNGDAQAGAYDIAILPGNGTPHASRTVTDGNDDFNWHTYTDFLDAGGARVLRSMVQDNGLRLESEYDDGDRTLLRVTDVADTLNWTRYTDTFDATGAVTARVMVMDNGQIVETTYEDGVRREVTVTDAGDEFVWRTIDTTYDASGVRTSQTNTYDDDRVLTNVYQGGVLANSTMTDPGDAYPWQSYQDTCNAAGERIERVMLMDDGSEIITSFGEDPGVL
ncbi:hypothetical protein [Antarctobacter heliothermus]|uniref:Uncharacterized protein n=1 Tax=Antarctobacter heliothermus TaxID=74033 RepID=A0A239HH11_9RHOB|nr:hypothetical protein [Antarctobacter heliothermus]SNS79544.1 hypothetical protein SAMN04488078_103316 [Antarctobacter heliothermus]